MGTARSSACRSPRARTAPAGWGSSAIFRPRGLAGVKLVTSDAHAGLVAAIGATLPGASWQRCRTHFAANLMVITPKSSWGWVKVLLHSVYDQPDAEAVHAQLSWPSSTTNGPKDAATLGLDIITRAQAISHETEEVTDPDLQAISA